MLGSPSRHVVVIGAGVAGLVAAYRLSRQGVTVTVLESQARVGGRALTIRDAFPPQLIAQAGPSRFPGEFARVQEYARRFGLELAPFYPDYGTVVAYLRGVRVDRYEPSPEEFWGYTALVKRCPGRAERASLRVALRLRRLARHVMGRPPWMTYTLRGGTDRLTDAMAAELPGTIRLETAVASVVQEAQRVRVRYSGEGGSGTLEADYVVCAVPLSMLARLHFSPPLSALKARLAAAVPFSSAVRIFLQMREAYWRKEGHNGFAVTDTLGEVWDAHHDEARPPALLVCYAQGELADRMGAMDEETRLSYAVRQLERIFPGAEEHFECGTSVSWRGMPWIRGGWPQVKGFAPALAQFRRPDGRVFFAGDYAAAPRWMNTMEGAIESGEHAADGVLRLGGHPRRDMVGS